MPSITGSIDQFSWIVIPLRILRQVLWGTLYRRFVNITDWIPRLILPQIMQRQMLVRLLVIVFDAWRMHLTLLVPISHRILDRIQALMGWQSKKERRWESSLRLLTLSVLSFVRSPHLPISLIGMRKRRDLWEIFKWTCKLHWSLVKQDGLNKSIIWNGYVSLVFLCIDISYAVTTIPLTLIDFILASFSYPKYSFF